MSSSTAKMQINVEFTGENRQGISKGGKPFFVLGAFASLPGVKYPQAMEIFTMDPSQVKMPGAYQVPLITSVKEGRLAIDLDLPAAQPVQAGANSQRAA